MTLSVDKMTKDKFNDFDVSLSEEIISHGKRLSFLAGEVVVKPENFIKVIPLLLKGLVKISRVDTAGNELFLYYIEPGASCAVSLASCLMNRPSNLKALAEEDTELIAVPITHAIKWFNEYPRWRIFVLETVYSRFEELIKTVDSMAFLKLDDRLISYLTNKSNLFKTRILLITHQEIANDLSTSREAVSRLLKYLEKTGKLILHRNRIEIIGLM